MLTRTASLLEVLERRTQQNPHAVQFRYLRNGEVDGPIEELTRGALLSQARALGTTLAAQTEPGTRVILMYPPGLDMFVAFLACLHADVIAVPMTPPEPQRIERTLSRLVRIVEQSGAKLVLSTAGVVTAAAPYLAAIPALAGLNFLGSDASARAADSAHAPPRNAARSADAIAFLQYTSGSLSAPMGVMVTDASLHANLEMLHVAMRMDERAAGVFWLPLHHDMGFIAGGLEYIYCGASCTMMSPIAFIQRPVRWLRAISRFGGVVSGAPCFAFERCIRRIADEELDGIDLQTWRVAYIAAEPIRASVLSRFATRFARCGFRRESLHPCYGMAEATVFVTGKPLHSTTAEPKRLHLAAAALEQHQVEPVTPAADGATDPTVRTVVSCGVPWLDGRVLIVNPQSKTRTQPGEIGEIWLAGPHVAAGYWGDGEKTAATFGLFLADTREGPFLATGDLGFMQDGELYVTGRSKELLILGGRNHYPQDLEETIEASHPDLRSGGAAAFSVDVAEEEVLVVAAEISAERVAAAIEPPTARHPEIVGAIRTALLKYHQVVPKDILFLPPQSLPKTTSGKKARLEMRRRFLGGQLGRP